MPNPLMDELRGELRQVVDETWSEDIRFLPQASGTRDPDRTVLVIQAVLRTNAEGDIIVSRRGTGTGTAVSSTGAGLRIDRSAYPGLIIKQGDKIVALERSGQPLFEILKVDDRSHLRLICELGDG